MAYENYNYVGKVMGKAGQGSYGKNAQNFFKSNYSKNKKGKIINGMTKAIRKMGFTYMGFKR